MVGDLKFLSMMLGKEDFDSYWCYLCMLSHPDWQQKGYASGELWTLDKLKKQAEIAKTKDGKERKGVREDPYFDIPVERFIWPILHTLIGIGNNILKYLVDIVENEIQHIPPKEMRVKRELKELEDQLEEQREVRDDWDSVNDGYGKELLKELRRDRTSIDEKMQNLEDKEQHLSDEYKKLEQTRTAGDVEITRLEKERNGMTITVKKTDSAGKKLLTPSKRIGRQMWTLSTLVLIKY